jgi:hypothetical protein
MLLAGRGGALINCLKYFKFSIVVVALALICVGCFPKAVGQASPDGKRLTWAEMSFELRKEHMRREILPRAAAFFGAWRPERFANVDCSLCHGQGYRSGNFNMPTAHLPRLSGELLLGPEFAKLPETTRLKLDRLVPMISEALGLKPFSIVTRTGFGCYSCHLSPTGAMFGN